MNAQLLQPYARWLPCAKVMICYLMSRSLILVGAQLLRPCTRLSLGPLPESDDYENFFGF